MHPYPHIRKSLFILFFVMAFGVSAHTAHAYQYTLDPAQQINATIDGSGYWKIDNLPGFDTTRTVLVNSCENTPYGPCTMYNWGELDPNPGSGLDTYASLISGGVITVNGGAFYSNAMASNPGSCSAGLCYGNLVEAGAHWSGFYISEPWIYFSVNSSGVFSIQGTTTPDTDTSTHIHTVAPANNSTIATSSLPYDFTVVGVVNASDYATGTRMMIKADRNTDQQAVGALTGFNSAFGNKTYLPITSSGTFNVSTSSDHLKLDFELRPGLYRTRYEIQAPKFNIFGFGLFYSTLAATSTRFTVGTTTGIDNIQLDQENYLQQIADNTLGSDPLSECQFSLFDSALDFSLGGKVLKCMGGVAQWLIIPPAGTIENTVTQLKDGFLTRVPIGYFTRIVSAISENNSASILPHLHVDVPVIGGGDDSLAIDFDIDQMVEDGADLQDTFQDTDGNSARDILEPIIQLIVGMLVLVFIYNDLHSFMRRL